MVARRTFDIGEEFMRAAVVGLGWWGKVIIRSLAGNERISVTHGVDLAPGPVAEFAAKHGVTLIDDFDAALADKSIDAVILTVPNSLHEPMLLKALAAGKQVFCEKPLALDVASARRMIEACEKAGVVLGMGHERRWEPAMQDLSRALKSGAIGRPLQVEANFSHSVFGALDAGSWRFDPREMPGAGFLGRGIHLTDFLVWLFGPASEVSAITSTLASEPPKADTIFARIALEGGVTALISVLTTTPFYGRFTVYGDRGWIEAREPGNAEHDEPAELIICDAERKRTVSTHTALPIVALNLEAWADAVEGRAAYPITPAQILANMQIFEAVVRSSETGQPVRIT
jgi:predicted dehydrogenase